MMDYSDNDFERFQKLLEPLQSSDPELWRLRDCFFREAFSGGDSRKTRLLRLPLGAVVLVAVEILTRMLRGARRSPTGSDGNEHFLFLSSRTNHINRLYSLFKERALATGWVTDPGILKRVESDGAGSFRLVDDAWIPHLKVGDWIACRSTVRRLRSLLGENVNRVQSRRIAYYLIRFYAWRRFWQSQLPADATAVYSTYEKAPQAKALFWVAAQRGVPRRVHWVHGLRHASLQSTLATELWCMTPGDVRYFAPRVPADCQVSVKRNPEVDLMVEKIGVIQPSRWIERGRVRFLFLGAGIETSYTKDLRMDDLAIIRAAQERFGDRIEWRFRPHPSAVERFRTELAEAGILADNFSAGDLYRDLEWADWIGSAWSSLLLDVRETGRRIFWVQAELRPLGSVPELVEDGIGCHLGRQNGLDVLERELNVSSSAKR